MDARWGSDKLRCRSRVFIWRGEPVEHHDWHGRLYLVRRTGRHALHPNQGEKQLWDRAGVESGDRNGERRGKSRGKSNVRSHGCTVRPSHGSLQRRDILVLAESQRHLLEPRWCLLLDLSRASVFGPFSAVDCE